MTERTSLRIVLFGNGRYASTLLPHLLDRGERVVAVCSRAPPRPRALERMRRWLGPLLRRLPLVGVDDHVLRGRPTEVGPLGLARQEEIRVLPADRIGDPPFVAALAELEPDLLLVAGFNRLVPVPVLEVPRRWSVNLHPSLLPRHRGGTPTRWVLRMGDRATGITAHLMTAEFDRGAILLQREVPVHPDNTGGDVEDRLVAMLPSFCDELLDGLTSGALRPVAQDESVATYEPPLNRTRKFIDWTQDADDVRRLCLALRPGTGALTVCRGRTLCIWDVRVVDAHHEAYPGAVIDFSERAEPIVACGSGAVAITTVLLRGRLRPASILRRRKWLRLGDGMRSGGPVPPETVRRGDPGG